MRSVLNGEIYDTEESKPIYDFIAKKERLSIYETSQGEYFGHRLWFINEQYEIPEYEHIELLSKKEFEKIKQGLPDIEPGYVGMVVRPWQDYIEGEQT